MLSRYARTFKLSTLPFAFFPLLTVSLSAAVFFALFSTGHATGTYSVLPPYDIFCLQPGVASSTSYSRPPAYANAPTICDPYVIQSSQSAIVPASHDIGNHCNDCATNITLPFEFTLYDARLTSLSVDSNGLVSKASLPTNSCLPNNSLHYSIMPYWDDLRTDCTGCGIFTETRGTAPNRIFDIEWRTTYSYNQGVANFELQLEEAAYSRFSIVYGNLTEGGSSATIGVQQLASSCWTEYSCNQSGLFNGLKIIFFPSSLNLTPTPSITPTRTATPTITPGGPTFTPAPSATPCTITFTDVHPTDYFYTPISYLYCHGIVSGYADNTFRPYNNTTRGQMVKVDVLGFALPIVTPVTYSFADVPPSHPFYQFVETAYAHSVVSGYTCGGPGEPCDPEMRPYFRPYNDATRGQISKIVYLAITGSPSCAP